MENYWTWAFSGLAYLFARKIERNIARYKIVIKKKVTV